jgi:hypothetical protein
MSLIALDDDTTALRYAFNFLLIFFIWLSQAIKIWYLRFPNDNRILAILTGRPSGKWKHIEAIWRDIEEPTELSVNTSLLAGS